MQGSPTRSARLGGCSGMRRTERGFWMPRGRVTPWPCGPVRDGVGTRRRRCHRGDADRRRQVAEVVSFLTADFSLFGLPDKIVKHADAIAAAAGSIDVSLNVIA